MSTRHRQDMAHSLGILLCFLFSVAGTLRNSLTMIIVAKTHQAHLCCNNQIEKNILFTLFSSPGLACGFLFSFFPFYNLCV